jgi:hypothetical protein
MTDVTEFDAELKKILELEVSNGNSIKYLSRPAGTDCPFGIWLEKPIDHKRVDANLNLSTDIELWEYTDKIYGHEKGYFSKLSKHNLAYAVV